MRIVKTALLVVVVASFCPESAPAQLVTPPNMCGSFSSSATLTAAEVAYGKARDAWDAANYPHAVAFSIVVEARDKDGFLSASYQGEEDLRQGRLFVDRFSSEEKANPFVARGVNLNFGLTLNGVSASNVRMSRDQASIDILGTPHLSATYSFGLARTNTVAVSAAQSSNDGLARIGRVTVVNRVYKISCDPVDAGTDGGTLHLTFQPLLDPRRYRLRDLWLDPATMQTLRLKIAGNFIAGPPLSVDWLVTFKAVGSAQYIDKEVAMGTLDFGHGRRYDDVSVRFENIEPLTKSSLNTLFKQPTSGDELSEP